MMKETKKNKQPSGKAGFAALIIVITVSAALLLSVLSSSQSVAVIFDEANHKEYRISATEKALACLHQVYLEFAHDYFYDVKNPGIFYPDIGCTVVSVSSISNNINNPSHSRDVVVSGQAGGGFFISSVTARVTAQVLLSDQKISLMSATTTF